MRYLASISYDGSKFYGFQKLKNHKTVQSELEKALTKINKTIIVTTNAINVIPFLSLSILIL